MINDAGMKSILVAVSGTISDNAVLSAAYALALPLKAHLDFVHIPLGSIEVADFNRHIEFARGTGLELALRDVIPRSEDAESKARAHVTGFCTAEDIVWVSQPISTGQVTASWAVCSLCPNVSGLVQAARAHDLVVIGRSAGKRSWSQALLESVAVDSGRPILIVPSDQARFELDRIAVWWKNHSAAARAVTAALPLLGAARQVNVLSVLEGDVDTAESAEDVARQLGWHGIAATVEILRRDHRPTVDTLWSASLAGKADIIVMGGYSRSRVREMILGGCTQSALDHGARPVFLMH